MEVRIATITSVPKREVGKFSRHVGMWAINMTHDIFTSTDWLNQEQMEVLLACNGVRAVRRLLGAHVLKGSEDETEVGGHVKYVGPIPLAMFQVYQHYLKYTDGHAATLIAAVKATLKRGGRHEGGTLQMDGHPA